MNFRRLKIAVSVTFPLNPRSKVVSKFAVLRKSPSKSMDYINRLAYLLKAVPSLLEQISAEDFNVRGTTNKWSKKEILGHLIDSATNNHHRLVRAQYERNPDINYDQDKWNEFSHWQKLDIPHIISLWTAYNQFLLELIKKIPNTHLMNGVKMGNTIVTIDLLIEDYITHLEHHLRQIVSF